MIERDDIIGRLTPAVEASEADYTELVWIEEHTALTRFAESIIHQNIDSRNGRLICRVLERNKVAIGTSNDISADGIARLIRTTRENASFLPEVGRFIRPPKHGPVADRATYVGRTTAFDATARADALKEAVKETGKENLSAAGQFRIETSGYAFVNSLGASQYTTETGVTFSLTASDDAADASGSAIAYNRDVGKIDVPALARYAARKAVQSREPKRIKAEPLTAILEPAAVGDLMLFLAFLAFGGMSFARGRSLLSGRIGEKITGDNITIVDDPTLDVNPGLSFDFEGVPKRKVTLIENGIAKGVVHNAESAVLTGDGAESTGHALPPDNRFGPYPKNMTLLPGDSSLEEMIASTKKGVLITRFWYVNYLNPRFGQLTATTRDGTFRIKNGEITDPIENLRVTPKMFEALARVSAIGRERVLFPKYGSAQYVPALKIEEFPFAENTEE